MHQRGTYKPPRRLDKRVVALASILSLCASVAMTQAQSPMIWIEAETPAQSNFEHFEISSMGKPALLSAGRWMMKGIAADEVQSLVSEEGIRLSYSVTVQESGTYNLWARVGWFGARADFRWSVGDGPWQTVTNTHPTINLMELGFFCEVSWAHLGSVSLEPGETTLRIHYPRVTDEKERMLVALDCFAFVQGQFTPEGPFKPGQQYDSNADREAVNHVFELPPPQNAQRVTVELTGTWQVARYDDPNMDKDTYIPVMQLPSPQEYPLRWMTFDVPGSPWDVEPLVFGHRLVFRTKVKIPLGHKGRGFKLRFSGTNWIVSVFINGRLAGTHRGVWVPWDLDVSQFVEPGKTNEIALAVKGTYYAFDGHALGGDGTIAGMRNRPLSRKDWTRWVAPMYPSTKGDGDGYQYGIVNPVTLISVGRVYVEDVFVKPSVKDKRLASEITIRNTTDVAQAVGVKCEAVHDRTGDVEKTFTPIHVDVPAGKTRTITVADGWATPKLWWPQPDPHLYRLRTTILQGNATLDTHEQLFGFREVTIEGTGVYINGVRRNVWNWVDVHANLIEQPSDWADSWRQDKSRFMRFSHGRRITQQLKTREQRLEFYDRNGIPGRLCTMIDGMFITFDLGRGVRTDNNQSRFIPNTPVWENFREHMAQVAKAYRNHPSVIFYQVENELVYINGMNIYGSHLGEIERLMNDVVEAGREHDPTRPYTVGGGGDLSGRLEINSPHYPHAAFDYYPENAYTLDHYAEKIQRWPWDRSKPWIVGESCFANELAFGAYVAGDEVFRGIDDARCGKAKWLRMLYGGYRWAGVAGFFPWDNLWNFEDARKVFSDLAAIPRKQTSRLYAGRENRLLFKIMNDTLDDGPVVFAWSYHVADERITADRMQLSIEPGHGAEQTVVITAPQTDTRLDGTLRLEVHQRGAETYIDERLIPVLPPFGSIDADVTLYVLDRQGRLTGFLRRLNVRFEGIDTVDALHSKRGLLLVGHDTLTPDEAFGTDLLAFAAGGGSVIVLEQDNAMAGAALPAPIKATTRFGGYAHPQALGTGVFKDLARDDLIDWAGDHPTYKNVYRKPTQGARSLAECGGSLEYSPLIEVPCGQGVMVLCQLRVAGNLGLDPAADVLLRNLIDVYANYRPSTGTVALHCPDDAVLAQSVQKTGILADVAPAVADAIDPDKYDVALLHASRKNLRTLVDLAERARRFQDAGKWIVLSGLTPEGIELFNEFVNGDFMIRPFRVERVTLENPQFLLAATLGNRDVALLSPTEIMHGRYWVSSNTFSYVVDNQDFAPFTLPPGAPSDPFEYKPTFDDADPYNYVNGMLSDDSWRYIRQIGVGESGSGSLTFRLRRPDVVDTIRIWNNEFYWTAKDVEITFDDDNAHSVTATLPDSRDLTTIKLPQPVAVQKTVSLRVASWRERPISRKELRLVGIDNVQFLRPRPRDKAIFLDSVGGLVALPRDRGGILLCQLKFMEDEPRPENAERKLRLLTTLLQNMGAGSKSALTVAVPGLNIRFAPLNIQEYCNAYLDDRGGKVGWFGKEGQNLEPLSRGAVNLADVEYHVVDYRTAPIPNCMILGGDGAHPSAVRDISHAVAGIKVGGKADLIFSLHTAHVARPITDRERGQMLDRRRPFQPPVVFKYVLHYADGQSAEIPVVLEEHIDHWLQERPKPLSGGQVAWSKPIAAAEGSRAVLYSMQAANPRPDVMVESIELTRTTDRATPAIVSISLGDIVSQSKEIDGAHP